jgi:hypothetical protein
MNANDSESPNEKTVWKIPGAQKIKMVKNAPAGFEELTTACVQMSTNSDPVHEKIDGMTNSHDPDIRQGLCYHRFNVERGMGSIGLNCN